MTITGPGGIGKSALARAAATRFGSRYQLGAIPVDLTRVDHGDATAGALAAQLGRSDMQSLLNTPMDQDMLVVVDNCEHVLDEVAEVIGRLLQYQPSVTILATSRSPLDLPEESILPVGPLAVPDPTGLDLTAPALELLVERAADHGVDIDLDSQAEAACRVVTRLDGMPLAIELAAAKLRSMSLDEIANDLQSRTHALARPRFRGRPEHRSVADLVNWSFDSLALEHRNLLINLSVFAGPFTASMATEIAGDYARQEVIDGLDELVNSSLISRARETDQTWFRLLYPVRAVARNHLAESGRMAEVESDHVNQIVGLAVGVITRSAGGWESTQVADLLALYDNITAAVRWTLKHDSGASRAQLLTAVLWGVIHQAHTAEIADLGEAVLQKWPDDRSSNWADARATVATCRTLLGDPDGAIRLAQSTLAEAGDDSLATATLRRVLAQAHRARSQTEIASEYFKAGAEAADSVGLKGLAMELWADHAVLLAELGKVADGQTILSQTHELALTLNADINVAWCLVVEGQLRLHEYRHMPNDALPETRQDALLRAKASIEQALTLARSIDYPAGILCGLRALTETHMRLGDQPAAAEAVLEMFAELQRRGNLAELRMVLDSAALVLEPEEGTSWAPLAVTAGGLPLTNVATPVEVGVIDRAGQAQPLELLEAFRTARQELQALLKSGAKVAAQSGVSIDEADSDGSHADQLPARWIDEGDVYRIDYGESTIRLRKSKGLSDLRRLLAEPDRELLALDLMRASVVQPGLPALDTRSRASYEARLRELDEVIQISTADNDLARAQQARAEFDTLVDELARNMGIGGRDRATGGDNERARSAVTRRIRDAIKRVESENDELGRHLRTSVYTGTYCRYSPERDPNWEFGDSTAS